MRTELLIQGKIISVIAEVPSSRSRFSSGRSGCRVVSAGLRVAKVCSADAMTGPDLSGGPGAAFADSHINTRRNTNTQVPGSISAMRRIGEARCAKRRLEFLITPTLLSYFQSSRQRGGNFWHFNSKSALINIHWTKKSSFDVARRPKAKRRKCFMTDLQTACSASASAISKVR